MTAKTGSERTRPAPWITRQTWYDLLFAHWSLASHDLRRVVPAPLALDTFDGRAWLGVIPFGMRNVRLRALPPLPTVSRFLELNVRTYVTHDGYPGVYFLSLDAGSRLAVAAARRWYRLPYVNAAMEMTRLDGWIRYTSRRTHHDADPAEFVARYAR